MGQKTGIFRFFLIQNTEKSLFRGLFFLSLLIGIPQISTITASSVLLLRDWSPEILPWLFLFSGAGLLVISGGLLFFLGGKSPRISLTVISGFLFLGTLALSTMIRLFPGESLLSLAAFFWSRVENALLAVMFLMAANALLPPRTNRRIGGLAASGQVITLVAGGLLVPFFLQIALVEDLLFFSLASHAGMFLWIRWGIPAHQLTMTSEPSHGMAKNTGLLLGIFASILVLYLVYYSVDSVFLGGLGGRFEDSGDLAGFLAGFWAAVGSIAFLFKTFVTGRVLGKFGLVSGLLLPPLALSLLVGTFFLPGSQSVLYSPLVFLVILKAAERLLDGSLFLPSYYGLFQGLSNKNKKRAQLLAESVVGQGAAGVAGFAFLLARQGASFDLETMLFFPLGFSLLLIPTVIWSFLSYRKTMSQLTQPIKIKRWEDLEHPPVMVEPYAPPLEKNSAPESSQEFGVDLVCSHISLMMGIRRYLRSGENIWPPLKEALSFEIQRLRDVIVRGFIRLNPRLAEPWKNFLKMPTQSKHRAVEGLELLIPARFRGAFLGFIMEEEDFLLDQSLKELIHYRSYQELRIQNPLLGAWPRALWMIRTQKEARSQWAHQFAYIDYLANSDFFRDFPLQYLSEIYHSARVAEYEAGEAIIKEGESGQSMFVLVRGRVDVLKGTKIVAELGPGSGFGELSALVPEERSASIIASQESLVLEIPRQSLMDFLDHNPLAYALILEVILQRIAPMLKTLPLNLGTPNQPKVEPRIPEQRDFDLLLHFGKRGAWSLSVLKQIYSAAEVLCFDAQEAWIHRPCGEFLLLLEGQCLESWNTTELGIRGPGCLLSLPESPAGKELVVNLDFSQGSRLLRLSAVAYQVLLEQEPSSLAFLTRELVQRQREFLRNR